MRRYTIAGTAHVAEGDRLYVPRDEEHGLDDLDPDELYLHDGRIAKISHEFTSVTVTPIHAEDSTAAEEVMAEDDFDGAVPVDAVTPDGIRECPNCEEGWLGPKEDDPDEQMCFECGYGRPENEA